MTTKRKSIKTLLIGLILYCVTATTLGNNKLADYIIAPIEDFPQSEVNDILLDKMGFVWFATLDGLFRYDGYEFKGFRMRNDGNSINSNMILQLAEDHQGNIWCGTYARGISKYNPRTEEFKNYDFNELAHINSSASFGDAKTLTIDHSNRIWIGNQKGIICIQLDSIESDIISSKFYPISAEDKQDNNHINQIFEDSYNNIWFACNNTLKEFKGFDNNQLRTISYPIQSIRVTGDSSALIICAKDGIYQMNYDLQTKQIKTPKKSNNTTLQHIVKINNHLWGGNRKGISMFNYSNGNCEKAINLSSTDLPFQFKSDIISCIKKISDKQLYIGTRGGGVYRISTKTEKFYNFPEDVLMKNGVYTKLTRCLFEDSKENLWIGYEEDGITIIPNNTIDDPQSYKHIATNHNIENRAYAFEETFHRKSNGQELRKIWVGTSFPIGLQAFNADTYEEIPLNMPPKRNIGFVFTIKKTDDRTLWIGTYYNGLYKYILDDEGNVIKSLNYTTRNSNISSNIIRNLNTDHEGNLWIATDCGINIIGVNEIKNENISFSNTIAPELVLFTKKKYILSITQISTGQILLGSMGAGLIVYNPKTKQIQTFTDSDGLSNNAVKTIIEDEIGHRIWVSTNKGISKIDLHSTTIVNYNEDNGIIDTEFCEICGLKRKDGTLIFGNRNGFVFFRSEEISENKDVPKLYISNLQINYKDWTETENFNNNDKNQKLSPIYLKHITIPYEQRNMCFYFVGLYLQSPKRINYLYKLDGWDNDWIATTYNQRQISYTNLQEGDYCFKVKASNGDGEWADPVQLSITITPPFSRTHTAYVIYANLAILLVWLTYYVIYSFYRKKRDLYRLYLERKKENEITQYQLEFFTNVSHELRTPLTLISIPLASLIEKCKACNNIEFYQELNIIWHNCQTLTALINQLLEFRKIENSNFELKTKSINLSKYSHKYLESFMLIAQQQNIDLKIKAEQSPIVVDIDPSYFDKVIYNLLSNAFKHTPHEGKITLGVTQSDNHAQIYVKDSGCGIDPKDLPHVFDLYFQGKGKCYLSQQKSSGIGLAFCKKIVQKMGGSISVDSNVDQGATFTITLPLSESSVYADSCIEDNADLIKSIDDTTDHLSEDSPITVMNKTTCDNLNDININIVNNSEGVPYKVLIVEDNDSLRDLLQKELAADFTVLTATNGQEGLDCCLDNYPDIIVTDIMMPVMDGLTMCLKIKECEEICHIPIIVLTANASIRNRIESFNIGNADAFMEKPFRMNVLKSQIMALIKSREMIKVKFRHEAIINPSDIAHTKTDMQFMSQIIDIIKKNMSNADLTIDMIAKEYGISRTNLNKKIKDLTGETSNVFLRNIRLKYAAQLIIQKEMNISEISWAVGYNDISTFRKRFKDRYGVAPTQYNGTEAISCDANTIE